MTLKAACQYLGKSETTIRRWIKIGKLKATLNNGKYDIDPADIESLVNPPQREETTEPATASVVIDQMTKQIDSQNGEIAFLRNELSQQSKRHDTILLQMTQQLDRAHLQLEDLTSVSDPLTDVQKPPSRWQQLKTAFLSGYSPPVNRRTSSDGN